MTFAAILVHAQPGAEARIRLDCARAMADMFDAILIGIGAEMAGPMPMDDGYSGVSAEWLIIMRETVTSNLKGARAAFDAVAEGRKSIWECGERQPGPAMASASRAADLIVASHAPGRHQDACRDAAPADLALTSGRPTLVAPVGAAPLQAKKIVLAWKDTREARRAMSDAMPFLERADHVLVLGVCEECDAGEVKIGIDDVVAALTRRGVSASASVAIHHPADGHEILRRARAFAADLIVTGAYGHTRLGEWAFGGVTRDLLAQDECYVLLSH